MGNVYSVLQCHLLLTMYTPCTRGGLGNKKKDFNVVGCKVAS